MADVEKLHVAVYTVPATEPESDGTLTWKRDHGGSRRTHRAGRPASGSRMRPAHVLVLSTTSWRTSWSAAT